MSELLKRGVMIHQGKNAKKYREAKNVKQEVIAQELNISQQAVSNLEKRAELDDATIKVYSLVLGIDEVFIRNVADDYSIETTSNFFDNSSQILNFNPLDKVVELFSDKDTLYERMLADKEKTSELLQKIIDKYLKV